MKNKIKVSLIGFLYFSTNFFLNIIKQATCNHKELIHLGNFDDKKKAKKIKKIEKLKFIPGSIYECLNCKKRFYKKYKLISQIKLNDE